MWTPSETLGCALGDGGATPSEGGPGGPHPRGSVRGRPGGGSSGRDAFATVTGRCRVGRVWSSHEHVAHRGAGGTGPREGAGLRGEQSGGDGAGRGRAGLLLDNDHHVAGGGWGVTGGRPGGQGRGVVPGRQRRSRVEDEEGVCLWTWLVGHLSRSEETWSLRSPEARGWERRRRNWGEGRSSM